MNLIERIRARQVVLVAGMGFSEMAGLPGWDAVLRGLTERLAGDEAAAGRRTVEDLIARNQRAAALAFLRARLARAVIAAVIAQAFPQGCEIPDVVRAVAALPWRAVVTTVFDDLWPRALGQGRPDAPGLVRVLGTPDRDDLCLSAADLHRPIRTGAADPATFLVREFGERSFFFAGFRPGDPDLVLLAQRMLGAAPTSVDHFLLLPQEAAGASVEAETEVLKADLGLLPVAWDGTLAGALRQLCADVQAQAPAVVTAPPDVMPPPSPPAAAGDAEGRLREYRAQQAVATGDDKADLLERMGDIYRQDLGNPVQAIASYRSALDLAPTRRPVMDKLAELYGAHRHWRPAADLWAKLGAEEPSPPQRARCFFRAAVIQKEELENPARAVELLERALDDAPEMVEAFAALEAVFTEARNWPDLARSIRQMLRRLPADGQGAFKARLLNTLGELSLKFLDDRGGAVSAFEAAAAADAGNVDKLGTLADLYLQAGPSHTDKAIDLHHALIDRDPDRLASYRALAQLYRTAGARDRLWCVAATLTFLRKAEPDIREAYERGRPAAFTAGTGRLSPETWELLGHPDEDRLVGALVTLVGRFVVAAVSPTPEALGIQPMDRVDAARDPRLAARVLVNVSRALDLPEPELYFDADGGRPALVRHVRERGPTIIVGASLAGRTDEAEVTFHLARAATLLRPEKLLRAVDPSVDFTERAVRALLRLGGVDVTSDAGVEQLSAEVRPFLPPSLQFQLQTLAREVAAAPGQPHRLRAWVGGTDLSATRAAFLLTNDLYVAARAIAADASDDGPILAKQRLKDLVAFSVSQRYFAARRAMFGSEP